MFTLETWRYLTYTDPERTLNMKDQYSPCDLIDFIIRFIMVYPRGMNSGKWRNDMMKNMYSLEKKVLQKKEENIATKLSVMRD